MIKNMRKRLNLKLGKAFVLIAVLLTFSLLIYYKSSLAFKNDSENYVDLKIDTTTTTKEEFIEKKVFGYSEAGRPIEGYEIGYGEEVILFFGSIHGNEMGTAELLGKLTEETKNNPNLLADTKKLVIIPILNPDGYYDRIDKLNSNEVNLNLNFLTSDWQQYGSDNGDYAGDEPFSEKESQVLRNVVETYNPKIMISFHAKGCLVNPEFSHEASEALARWYSGKTGYTYFNDKSWDYSGTATKWFVESYGRAAITVELSDYLESDWEVNKVALIELISTDVF